MAWDGTGRDPSLPCPETAGNSALGSGEMTPSKLYVGLLYSPSLQSTDVHDVYTPFASLRSQLARLSITKAAVSRGFETLHKRTMQGLSIQYTVVVVAVVLL